MATYTFLINGEGRTVEADDLAEALEKAGIDEGYSYELT
jgi:hypothetical protein